MKIYIFVLIVVLVLLLIVVFVEIVKDIVVNGLSVVFVDCDVVVIDIYFSFDYVQYNFMFLNGIDVFKGFVVNMLENFVYEIGNVIVDEGIGFVVIYFCVEGFGFVFMVGVDILCVENGLIVEYWDVL